MSTRFTLALTAPLQVRRAVSLSLLTFWPLLGACDGGHGAPADPDGGIAGSDAGPIGSSLPPRICRTPEAPAGPWFVEVTEELGLAKSDALEPQSTGIVAGDLDGDGYQDIIAAVFPAQRDTSRKYHFLFMNRPSEGDPTRRIFVDATAESGLLHTRDGGDSSGISVFSLGDLDSDGDLDVIGCPGSGELMPPVVDGCTPLLNDGHAHFTLAPESDLTADVYWVPSSVMLDFDEDGILDFWPGTVGQWAYGPAPTSRMRVYHGVGDGTFTDVASDLGLPASPTAGGNMRINFGATSCDLDNDGDRDVMLGNYYVQQNLVYRNDGGHFTEIAPMLGANNTGRGGHTFTMTCGDLEDDGDNDLMLSEVHHPGAPTDPSALLLNDTPPGEALTRFRKADMNAMGIGRSDGWMEGDNMTSFVDVDLDGRKDLFVASSNYPQQGPRDPDWTHAWLWQQQADGTFSDVTSSQTPWASRDFMQQSLEGPVWVDFDNDGDLDLLIGTGAFNGMYIGAVNRMHAYRNDVGHLSNWTKLHLVGGGPGAANRSAIGARVRLTVGGRTQYQEVMGSWGHSNTQNDVLTFGLGEACEIDRIEVLWPDAAGSTTVLENVLGNYAIEIRQGESAPRYIR